ncbi:helix-turn-helix transcriptional regulator [Crassaminicella thermophila]|uniref:Helix-turn-helix transcriptional regulator n=1 Tax=Crassaminicella thermophila TaxID=2599308 RepID=A0A5C0SG27_CRATE|nr:helix-turn-helix transcriptional regulator [Crassaminicella thermophila]QEK12564.1 helix-turn-helix transcriptional regulator [Crassaminicella thermophila]QEK12696.1 helix-turn-helix transcriptional regulator [Crassaminicella thermophila]
MAFKKVLEDNNVSGYRLSKDIGIPQQTISDYVSGKKNFNSMKIGVAKKIADYLGMTLDELYEKSTN